MLKWIAWTFVTALLGACGEPEARGLFGEACITAEDCEAEFDCYLEMCTPACTGDATCASYAGASCVTPHRHCFWSCAIGASTSCRNNTVCDTRGLCVPDQ